MVLRCGEHANNGVGRRGFYPADSGSIRGERKPAAQLVGAAGSSLVSDVLIMQVVTNPARQTGVTNCGNAVD